MIEYAYAADAATQQGPSALPLMLILGVVAYFTMFRPMSKQRKAAEQKNSNLSKNDEVILNNGLVGKITKITDEFLTIEIAPNTEVYVQKHLNTIAYRLDKGSIAKIVKGTSLNPKKEDSKTKAEAKDRTQKNNKKAKQEDDSTAKTTVEPEQDAQTDEKTVISETVSESEQKPEETSTPAEETKEETKNEADNAEETVEEAEAEKKE